MSLSTKKYEDTLPLIGITAGDPAGIGPELCLRLLHEKRILEKCIPLVFGDANLLQSVAEKCSLTMPKNVIDISEWKRGIPVQVPTIINCKAIDADRVQPGKVNAECGRAAYTYIEESIQAALATKIAAVTTGPINKESLHLAGIPYPGHTEIFTELSLSKRVCMMLTSNKLTVSFVTTHIGYSEVPDQLSIQRIQAVIELTADAMTILRGRKPNITVCGLNPHAGEHGIFGNNEEQKYIEPAIAAEREKGLNVSGPIPPDTAFVPQFIKDVDAIVCMYHDQGHIPFKLLAFDSGVNVTLGLPIVRTSVDHGTAFNIAWQGIAKPDSFIEAVLLAVRLSSGRLQGPGHYHI